MLCQLGCMRESISKDPCSFMVDVLEPLSAAW